MSRFRPQLEALDARDVPASFSFQLPDGTVVSGQFATPDGIDPDDESQDLDIPDLTLTVGTTTYSASDFSDSPVANYSEGWFGGVYGELLNPPPGYDYFALSYDFAEFAIDGQYDYVMIAYDAADTQATFTLSNGTTGALSYAIPWDQVDSTQASQSLTPPAFNLNIAGQNFTYGSATYTTAPALLFEYGAFQGVSFALTPPAGFAYTSISASFDDNGSNIIEAIQAGTGQQLVAAPIPRPVIELDFTSATTGRAYTIDLSFSNSTGNSVGYVSIDVSITDTASDIANKLAAEINANTQFVASQNGSHLRLTTKPTSPDWRFLDYNIFNPPAGVFDPTLLGATVEKQGIVTVTGRVQQPQ